MRSKFLRGCCLAAVAAGFVQAHSASAADDASAPPKAAVAEPALDEVIVTASKRSENLQKAPVAVTAVNEDQLKSLNITSIGDIPAIAPSTQFQWGLTPNVTQLVIRGIGTFAFQDGLEQSVGVSIDGIPLGRLVGSVVDTVDVAQVEVLRGPQGTLFGKSATAGLIDVKYADPVFTQQFTGRAFTGSYDEHRIQATENLPIIDDKLALRVSAWDFTRSGYVNAPFQPNGVEGGMDDQGVRIKAAILPTPDWRIDLTGEFRADKGSAPYTVRSYLSTDIIQPLDKAVGITAGPNNLTTGKDFPESGYDRQARTEVKSVWDIGDHELTAIVGYIATQAGVNLDTDSVYDPGTTILEPSIELYTADNKQVTSELRFASTGSSPLQYTVGLFYYHLDVNSQETNAYTRVTPPVGASNSIVALQTMNYALFDDVSYSIGDLRVFAGERLSHERTSGTLERVASQWFPASYAISNGPLSVDSGTNYNDFSWRTGAEYQLTPDVMLYGTASRAYKGPGLNYTISLTPAQFAINKGVIAPEIAHSYELGVRSRFFDHQLTANLTGYYSPFTNFQVTAVAPTVPPTYTTVNAKEAVAKGLELEFAIHPHGHGWADDFSLTGNATYNDAKFTNFANAPCFDKEARSLVPTSQSNVCAPVALGSSTLTQNVSGDQTSSAPPWAVNLVGGYDHPVTDTYSVFGQVHYSYKSSIQFAIGPNPATLQAAYSLVDLTAGFGPTEGPWKISFYAKNVFDQHFSDRVSAANPGVVQSIPYEAVRSFGVAVDVAF